MPNSTRDPEPTPPGVGDAPVNVLLVDDQPGRLLTYRAILEPLGERLVDASSGTEALKRLMEDEFAVILLDVNMPGMDGFETASLIHQHPRFEKTPIIFVTAVNVTDMDRLRGYKLGAVDYVLVPVIPEILRSKVEVLSELFRKRRELQHVNAELAAYNQSLVAERSRELEQFNESLRQANTELAARNAELRVEVAQRAKAEQRLRDADARKDEFLATLAHELRNPLAPLQNALAIRRLAQEGGVDGLQELMERQLALLVRMLDDLLDVARVTRGKMLLRRCVVLLDEVVRNAIDTAQPLLSQFGHELSVHLPEQPVTLYADPARLAQVFANLLNNAAKYSEPGKPITLEVKWQPPGEVSVQVIDQGIGLSPQDAQTVFDPFRQLDTAVDRTHGGLGIGLTLVQRLVSLHGGRVAVASGGPGQGATFTVVLPCGDGLVLPEPPAPDAGAEPASAPVRVLVVDDNRDAADTLATLIRILGHDVSQLYDPYAVEQEVDRFAPDLVFLDVGMPGRSGFDVARALRERPGGDALSLVAVTGWGQPEDRRRSMEAGFDEHLVKPPELDAVRRLCRRQEPLPHPNDPTYEESP
ncbi:response regulator [Agrilutibacter solisilvae]|uniref:histidine kinase n=1 Tax=Agrilutibacter solisilvae TaxID=2763317 RepID=A0A975ATH0_9GAMM|nr:response regulator [Lysobacter solisilvae]QSX79104.1 response regulator [Lysobacter solisilvae]